jgi:regulator of protease activity HflC (stomatin/prohibitin superfamily)
MSNNRSFISDSDIIRPTQLLDKGIPLPFMSGRFTVDEGWCAIVTEGGAFKEIWEPGTYFLEKYHWRRDVKATLIDKRLKTLSVSTTREFTISQPVPVEINLDLSVEYQVTDPRKVATEISTPLTSLYDRVIQAVRGVVVYATVEEIRTQGEGIARNTLQRLQGMTLPKILGVEVSNVLVTQIKATDAGTDALAGQQMKEYTAYRDWQMDSAMTQQSKVTWEWLLLHRPEIAQQMLATYGVVAKEMIDKGLLDPAGFLNQPNGSPNNMAGLDLNKMLNPFGFGSNPMSGTQQGQIPATTSPGGNQPLPIASSNDIHTRMREEISYLQKLPGAKVENKGGTDDMGTPNGSYEVMIQLPRSSGGTITLYASCPAGYPQQPPIINLDLDDQPTPFESPTLRRWAGQYLVEIAREAKQHFG